MKFASKAAGNQIAPSMFNKWKELWKKAVATENIGRRRVVYKFRLSCTHDDSRILHKEMWSWHGFNDNQADSVITPQGKAFLTQQQPPSNNDFIRHRACLSGIFYVIHKQYHTRQLFLFTDSKRTTTLWGSALFDIFMRELRLLALLETWIVVVVFRDLSFFYAFLHSKANIYQQTWSHDLK